MQSDGKVVFRNDNLNRHHDIYSANLSSGIYLVLIEGKKKYRIEKVIIEN